jgi:hypothetical protein
MKTQGNWVVGIGWRTPRIDVAGDICLRSLRPTQGCRADDDDDDDDDDDLHDTSLYWTRGPHVSIIVHCKGSVCKEIWLLTNIASDDS